MTIPNYPESMTVAAGKTSSISAGASKPAASAGDDDEGLLDWARVWSFFSILWSYHRLFGVIFVVAAVCIGVWYATAKQTYTAVAVIGPPGPSPTGSMIASMGVGSLTSGLSAKILGGLGSNSKDPFQEYLQLLPSSRLCEALIGRDHFLQTIYYRRWDNSEKKWKAPGGILRVVNFVKWVLNRPIMDRPGVDDLMNYLTRHISIDASKSTQFDRLTDNSPYKKVSFTYGNPKEAERLLNIILLETDRIIRDEQRRDVTARIAFLRGQLSHTTLSVDERAALISILSSQEQLLSMIHADTRFATTLVIPPYASPTPTSPPGPRTIAVVIVMLSVFVWVGIVFLGTYDKRVERRIAYFKYDRTMRRRASADRSVPGRAPDSEAE